MTREQKLLQLMLLKAKAEIAERQNLPATAQWWWEAYENVRKKPASEMILTKEHEMDLAALYSGNHLKAEDLKGKQPIVTIEEVTTKQFEKGQKAILHFVGTEKTLPLNMTNFREIRDAYGTESAAWIGQKIQLYRDRTHFKGEMVDCVRVRVPEQPAPPPRKPAATHVESPIDDEIPF